MAKLTLFDPPISDSPPDPALARAFVRCLTRKGKTAAAQRIFNKALDQLGTRVPDRDPRDVCADAVDYTKPSVEVRPRRVGCATYPVPMRVNKLRQQSLAIRWIVNAARGQRGRPMYLRLADEIMAAYQRRRENV